MFEDLNYKILGNIIISEFTKAQMDDVLAEPFRKNSRL